MHRRRAGAGEVDVCCVLCECCLDCYKGCILCQEDEEEFASLKRLEKDLQTTFPHLDIVVEHVWHKSRGPEDPDRWMYVVHIRPGGSGFPKAGMERSLE